jgi:hypothetical protein
MLLYVTTVLWLFSYDVIAAPGEGNSFADRMEDI